MSKRTFALLFCTIVLAACQTSVLEEEDKVLPEADGGFTGQTEFDLSRSYLSFIGKSNLINHEGTFERFTVDMTTAAADPSDLEKAQLNVTIDVGSVKTDAG